MHTRVRAHIVDRAFTRSSSTIKSLFGFSNGDKPSDNHQSAGNCRIS